MPRQSGRPTDSPERHTAEGLPPRAAEGERLQRVLARAGFGSRRAAEDLIREGRVEVNGRVAELGRRVDPERDAITLSGVPIATHPALRYFALNKPAGVTSTMRDPHAESSLARFVPPGPRVFPVGRLDRDSEGLLLMTNDGELAYRLAHPKFGVEKEYLAEVEGVVSRGAVQRLVRGVDLADGPARALRARALRSGRGRSSVNVVMGEGRKREVRRMLDAVGFPVRRLVRVRQGPIRLGGMPPAASRPLDAPEIAELYRAVGLDRAAVRGRVVHHRRP
jgi:23S rRNA pseudouridine2605 synthase